MKLPLNRHRAPPRTEAGRGFTLIELMITVAIVALLASIAYPAYTDSIRKGRRAEGRAALTDLLQQQERHLTQTGWYMTFDAGATGANGTVGPSTSPTTGATIPFKTTSGDNAANAAYNLEATRCTSGSVTLERNECVLLRAVPVRGDPEVGDLTLMSTGAKGCSGTNQAKCWR